MLQQEDLTLRLGVRGCVDRRCSAREDYVQQMECVVEMGSQIGGICIFPTHAVEKLASAAITIDDAGRQNHSCRTQLDVCNWSQG